MNTTMIGRQAEQCARKYLENNGLKYIAANVRTRFYELDLIMQDGDTIVIVEVKYRSSQRYGGGEAALDNDKSRRLIAAAEAWHAQYSSQSIDMRIDLVTVTGKEQVCRWYCNIIEERHVN